jgi:hypothetical protein
MYSLYKHKVINSADKLLKLFVFYIFVIFGVINIYNYFTYCGQYLSQPRNTEKNNDLCVEKKGYTIVELCSLVLILHQFW